ncbi:MAG TPA: hypothetical protein VF062_09190, partial [Candidatus Limnocylindrales bacterium]
MNLPSSPVNLREIVAANLRRLRNVTNAEPADVVRAAAHFGLEWTASWYSAVEKGQKPLSAEQLLALPPILTSALAYRVSLSDLLLGEGSMHLGQPVEGTTISLHYLRELVTASPFRRSFLDFDEQEPPAEVGAAQAAAAKMREIVRANLGDVDIRALARAETGAGDAEAKLARKLGVPEIVVIAAAASMWGHSMTEEREAQLNPEEGDPPKPSTVSRRLTTAITHKLDEATKAAEAKAAIAAATSSVTAEFPLVQLDGPRRKPTEVASESLRERYMRTLPLQRTAQYHQPDNNYQPPPETQAEPEHAQPEHAQPEHAQPEYAEAEYDEPEYL